MADKTTTLKTKTNDNVYPNIIGDNMDNAIVDSAHINHTLTKDHKINFRLDTNVSGLIFNSLQKPTGLTKTELVGVGANGQENIEIGDNLTLANGKLSATGGGSGGFNILTYTGFGDSFKGNIDKNAINVLELKETGALIIENNTVTTVSDITTEFIILGHDYYKEPTGNLLIYTAKQYNSGEKNFSLKILKLRLYSHFITLTNNTSTFYFIFQNTSKDNLNTLDSLKTALSGKVLLCNGHTDSETAEYISGKGSGLIVGVIDKSDNSTSGITIDSSFTISDDVSAVK